MAAKNKQIKKIISWVVGLPAALIAVSEPTDLRLWWVQFAAIAVLAVVLFANGVFDETRERRFGDEDTRKRDTVTS